MSKKAIIDNLRTVLDAERAEAVEEFRRITIKKPLTAYGAKRLAMQLARWPDPAEAADMMIDKCWRGFKPEWVRPAPAYGRTNYADAARNIIHGSGDIFGAGDDVQRLSSIGRRH